MACTLTLQHIIRNFTYELIGAKTSRTAWNFIGGSEPQIMSLRDLTVSAMALLVTILGGIAGPADCHAQTPDWTNPQTLNTYYAIDRDDDTHPRLAMDTSGTLLAAWAKPTSLAFSRSDNGGTSWTEPVDVLASATVVNRVNVVHVGNSTWVALATAEVLEWRNSGKVIMLRSTDDGHTWSSPQIIYSGQLTAEIDMAADPGGIIIATMNTLILRSTDFGVTWTQSNPVPSSESGVPFESHIARTPSGKYVHVYRKYIYNPASTRVTYEIRSATSIDGGLTWQDNLAYQIEDRDGTLRLGDVAADGDGVVIAQAVLPPGPPWDQNRLEILVSNDGGTSYSTPKTVTLGSFTDFEVSLAVRQEKYAVTIDPGYLAVEKNLQSYLSDDGGNTWQAAPWPDSPESAELQPSVSFLPGGELFALYQLLQVSHPQQPGPDGDIGAASLSTAGTSWTLAGNVNANADADFPVIDDTDVQLEASPYGTVLAVWTAAAKSGSSAYGNRVHIRRSFDFGKTWNAVQFLTHPSFPPFEFHEKPQIVYVGGTAWLAYWKSTRGWVKEYYSSSSTDDGLSWTEPALLKAQHAASNREGLLIKVLVVDADPNDYDYNDYHLTFSRSTDNGQSWDTPSTARVTSLGFVRHLEHIGGSTWMLGFKNGIFRTTNDGASWNSLGTPGADIGGMHHVASNHAGVVMAIVSVFSYNSPAPAFETYSQTSNDFGSTWNIISMEKQTDRKSGFLYNTFPEPRVSWIGGSKWMAVWHTMDLSVSDQSQTRLKVHYSLTENNGSTWSPPAPIAPAAGIPSAGQLFPDIATAQGNIIVGWQNYLDSAGEVPPLGYDTDLFFSRTSISGFTTAAQDWQLFE